MLINTGAGTIDLPVNDKSYRLREIMGENSLTLFFSMSSYQEIPIGSYVDYQGERYTLGNPENFKKHGRRKFEYTAIFDSEQSKLKNYKLRNTVDKRLKFSFTAKPQEHLQQLVDNLNDRDAGWTVGNYIESSEKLLNYNHTNCFEALSMMAKEFNTEYEIVNKAISLKKVEYNKSAPLSLSYGKGRGLKPGVGRTNFDGSNPIEKLFIQGGEKNIDFSSYGNRELLLPKNQQIVYESRPYITDAEGMSITRSDKPLVTNVEDSLDLSNIYPQRVGAVSSVAEVDPANNFYDFIDISIPNDLDFDALLIEGETLTVIFESGMLVSREFDVKYIHAENRFEIVPQEIDGQTMPNATFKPAIGDSYAVFGMMLPAAYISDNATKTGASWDMFRDAVKYLYEHEDVRFSYNGEVDGIWAKKNWLNIDSKIVVGGYISFTDDQFQIEAIPTRLTVVKQFINNPYSPVIELSNVIEGRTVSSDIRKIEEAPVAIEDSKEEVMRFAKRRFRDAKETSKLLEASLLNFSSGIDPISVKTMQLIAGDESLQFRFVDKKTDPITQVDYPITYDAATKRLTAPGSILQHMTIGIKDISSTHIDSKYRFWDIPAYNSGELTDSSKSYYLYIKVKISEVFPANTFVLSETAIGMNDVANFYHLLVGILNSEFDGDRSFAPMYGYTEILPGRITVDRIVSSDGFNYLDFVENSFRIGDLDKYMKWAGGDLRIKGMILLGDDGQGGEFTVINSQGIYTGTLTAQQLNAAKATVLGAVTAGSFTLGNDGNGNPLFKVDSSGNLTAINANIKGAIEAVSGKIGGFTIVGNGMSNIVNQGYIIIRNAAETKDARIGSSVFPSSSGSVGAAYFHITEDNVSGANIGVYAEAINNAVGGTAYAVYSKGLTRTNALSFGNGKVDLGGTSAAPAALSPKADLESVFITGNSSSDRYYSLGAGYEKQQIIIFNRNDNQTSFISGIFKSGDYLSLLGGESLTLMYLTDEMYNTTWTGGKWIILAKYNNNW